MGAAAMIAAASAKVGYREGRNNDTVFGQWYGMNHQPWCMMFLSWCAAHAGIGEAVIPKLAYVPYCVSFYRQKGLYHEKKGYQPAPGDLVFFGQSDHVGLVEQVENGRLHTIEGNTSAAGNSSNGDGVYRRSRSLGDGWIMGYASPEYEEEDMEIRDIVIEDLDRGRDIHTQGFLYEGRNYILLRDLEKLAPLRIGYNEQKKAPTVQGNWRE